jgi:hypothetical protein
MIYVLTRHLPNFTVKNKSFFTDSAMSIVVVVVVFVVGDSLLELENGHGIDGRFRCRGRAMPRSTSICELLEECIEARSEEEISRIHNSYRGVESIAMPTALTIIGISGTFIAIDCVRIIGIDVLRMGSSRQKGAKPRI